MTVPELGRFYPGGTADLRSLIVAPSWNQYSVCCLVVPHRPSQLLFTSVGRLLSGFVEGRRHLPRSSSAQEAFAFWQTLSTLSPHFTHQRRDSPALAAAAGSSNYC